MAMDESVSGGWSVELWLSERDDGPGSTELQRRVWEELELEQMLQAADLRVEVIERIAILYGTVAHHPAMAAAERAARRAEGLRGIENRIRVSPPAVLKRSDAELLAGACRALEASAVVPQGRVTVAVEDGNVTLQGEVAREYERDAAAEIVGHLAGVTGVRNLIALRPASQPERLRERVEDAVRHERPRHVSIETRGGMVVLRGRVRSLAQRDALEHAVWGVAGVVAVQDDLSVDR